MLCEECAVLCEECVLPCEECAVLSEECAVLCEEFAVLSEECAVLCEECAVLCAKCSARESVLMSETKSSCFGGGVDGGERVSDKLDIRNIRFGLDIQSSPKLIQSNDVTALTLGIALTSCHHLTIVAFRFETLQWQAIFWP